MLKALKKQRHKFVNINIRCTRFHNLQAYNNHRQFYMPLKVNQSKLELHTQKGQSRLKVYLPRQKCKYKLLTDNSVSGTFFVFVGTNSSCIFEKFTGSVYMQTLAPCTWVTKRGNVWKKQSSFIGCSQNLQRPLPSRVSRSFNLSFRLEDQWSLVTGASPA